MLLESSPILFRPEVIEKCNLTEEVHIQNNPNVETVQPLMRVRGKFQDYDTKNANNRIYPKALWDRCLNEESWLERLKENSVIGQVEHPEDGITKLTGPISHIVTKAYDNGDGTIWGEATVLNTPDGRKMGALFEAGVPIGISSRGEGEVESVDESVQRVIPESFSLISWDFVADNSVIGAKVKLYKEEAKKHVETSSKSTKKESVNEVTIKSGDNEYLNTIREKKIYMSKIGEMRKVGLQLEHMLQIDPSKLKFQARVGLTESLGEIRSQITSLMKEDLSVEAYGNKLLKEVDEFNDEVEGGDADLGGGDDLGAPEEPSPGPGDGLPGDECAISKEDFSTVFTAVLDSLCGAGAEAGAPPEDEFGGGAPPPPPGGPPGAPGGNGGAFESRRRKLAAQRKRFESLKRQAKKGRGKYRFESDFPPSGGGDDFGGPPPGGPPGADGADGGLPPTADVDPAYAPVIDSAYEEFCQTGSIDVQAAVDQVQGGGDPSGGDDFDADAPIEAGGGEGGAGGDDMSFGEETKFESKKLRAAVAVIARLRESASNGERYRALVEELKERIKVHHPLLRELEEARKKIKALEGGTEWSARIERNKSLLARAKTEIDKLRESYEEEKEVNAAFVTLLKKNGIKNADKLAETTRKKVTEEELPLGDGETATRVGKGPTSNVTTSGAKSIGDITDGECDDISEKPENAKGSNGEGVELGDGETATTVGGSRSEEASDEELVANLTEDEKAEYEDLDETAREEFLKRIKGKKSTSGKALGKDEEPDKKGFKSSTSGRALGKKECNTESKKANLNEHDFLRRVKRQRSNAWNQL